MLKVIKSGMKLGLILFLIQSILICIDGLRDKKTKAAIGIVLGNKINPDGSPSERLQERLNKSIQLYRADRIQMILVSGGFGKEGFCHFHLPIFPSDTNKSTLSKKGVCQYRKCKPHLF